MRPLIYSILKDYGNLDLRGTLFQRISFPKDISKYNLGGSIFFKCHLPQMPLESKDCVYIETTNTLDVLDVSLLEMFKLLYNLDKEKFLAVESDDSYRDDIEDFDFEDLINIFLSLEKEVLEKINLFVDPTLLDHKSIKNIDKNRFYPTMYIGHSFFNIEMLRSEMRECVIDFKVDFGKDKPIKFFEEHLNLKPYRDKDPRHTLDYPMKLKCFGSTIKECEFLNVKIGTDDHAMGFYSSFLDVTFKDSLFSADPPHLVERKNHEPITYKHHTYYLSTKNDIGFFDTLFKGCTFENVVLHRVNFIGCAFEDTTFDEKTIESLHYCVFTSDSIARDSELVEQIFNNGGLVLNKSIDYANRNIGNLRITGDYFSKVFSYFYMHYTQHSMIKDYAKYFNKPYLLDFSDIGLSKAKENRISLEKLHIKNLNLDNVDPLEMSFSNCSIENSSFRGATFDSSNHVPRSGRSPELLNSSLFLYCDFSKASFLNTSLPHRITLWQNREKRDSGLKEKVITHCYFMNCNFNEAKIEYYFINCSFKDCTFWGTDLTKAMFEANCTFENCVFDRMRIQNKLYFWLKKKAISSSFKNISNLV